MRGGYPPAHHDDDDDTRTDPSERAAGRVVAGRPWNVRPHPPRRPLRLLLARVGGAAGAGVAAAAHRSFRTLPERSVAGRRLILGLPTPPPARSPISSSSAIATPGRFRNIQG